jgi:hypothetical protein
MGLSQDRSDQALQLSVIPLTSIPSKSESPGIGAYPAYPMRFRH